MNKKKEVFEQRKLPESGNSSLYLGRHITLDYYDCNESVLRDKKLLEQTLIESAKSIGATIISSHFNQFEPQGVSGVVVLSESHFTIHSWPETGYAAIDMFACGDMNFEKGIDLLTQAFQSKRVELITDLKRGEVTQFEKDKRGDNTVVLTQEGNNWEKDFEKNNTWGIATSVDVFGCDPNMIRNADAIKVYVKELCDLILMKTSGETQVVHFGENEKIAGYSMTQLIETSLISGRFANATNAAYLDIFSCKYYNPNTVADFTVRYFKGKYFKLNINMRDEK